MGDTLLVSTRKGLFTVSRKARQWAISAVDFLGDNVSLTLTDPDRAAIADERSGSVKRVAAAVGEGAQIVATLHAALSAIGRDQSAIARL